MTNSVQPSRGLRSRAFSRAVCAALLVTWPAATRAQGDQAVGNVGDGEQAVGNAAAEVSPGGAGAMRFELGFYAGAFMPDESHEFYDWRVATQEPLEPIGPEIGARAGFFPLRTIGIEGEADLLPQATESGAGVLLFGARAHLLLQAPGRITPFLLGGLGVMGIRSDREALARDVDALGHLGLGAKVRIAEGFAIRLEGRALRAPRAGADDGTTHFAVLLGGAFTLGGSSRSEPALVRAPPAPPRPPAVARAEPPPPKVDVDADGVPDQPQGPDACAQEPEDRDGFEDEDGCPDRDNDRDELADGDDGCPLEAGPVANRGCPDQDRDGDGVVDRIDNCPEQVGTGDDQGCSTRQLVVLTADRIRLLDPITFTTGRAEIRRRSLLVLDNLAAVLASHPALVLIRIAGHTDDRGEAAYNKELSRQRAEMVKQYLVGRGVAAGRLDAVGHGEEAPLEPNTTAAGRASNRRVDVEIAERSIAP